MSDPRRTSASKPSRAWRLRNILGKNVRTLSFIPRERRFYDLFEQQAVTIVRSAGLLEQALADVANLAACQREVKALGSANRDERHFEDPDALDLARDPNRHLAFGRGGVHHCLGAPLARLEGQLAIGVFLRRFPEASLAVTPDSLRWRRGLFLRGLERLPLVL
jgi:hypothetical protein